MSVPPSGLREDAIFGAGDPTRVSVEIDRERADVASDTGFQGRRPPACLTHKRPSQWSV